MILEGIFQCTRCHAVQTALTLVKNEGTVCIDEETCRAVREMSNGGDWISS